MKFEISRTSVYDKSECPCEGAVQKGEIWVINIKGGLSGFLDFVWRHGRDFGDDKNDDAEIVLIVRQNEIDKIELYDNYRE